MNKPAGRKLFSPKTSLSKEKVKEGVSSNKLVTNNFDSGPKDDFDVLCNMVSVLPREYDCVTVVVEPKYCEEEEMVRHKPVCYFMMNNSCI